MKKVYCVGGIHLTSFLVLFDVQKIENVCVCVCACLCVCVCLGTFPVTKKPGCTSFGSTARSSDMSQSR